MEDIKGILTFTDQELYCLARHIKFYFQTHWQKKTDIGEPCETCPGRLFCKIDFVEVFQKLGDLTGEKIQILKGREPNGYTYNLAIGQSEE